MTIGLLSVEFSGGKINGESLNFFGCARGHGGSRIEGRIISTRGGWHTRYDKNTVHTKI